MFLCISCASTQNVHTRQYTTYTPRSCEIVQLSVPLSIVLEELEQCVYSDMTVQELRDCMAQSCWSCLSREDWAMIPALSGLVNKLRLLEPQSRLTDEHIQLLRDVIELRYVCAVRGMIQYVP